MASMSTTDSSGRERPSPLRLALEKNNGPLAGRRVMSELIPTVLKMTLEELDAELEEARQQSPDGILRYRFVLPFSQYLHFMSCLVIL